MAPDSGIPMAGRPNFRMVGSIEMKAAPKNEPIRLPSPPMMTMNRIVKLWLMLNASLASPPPYHRNIMQAPATPA